MVFSFFGNIKHRSFGHHSLLWNSSVHHSRVTSLPSPEARHSRPDVHRLILMYIPARPASPRGPIVSLPLFSVLPFSQSAMSVSSPSSDSPHFYTRHHTNRCQRLQPTAPVNIDKLTDHEGSLLFPEDRVVDVLENRGAVRAFVAVYGAGGGGAPQYSTAGTGSGSPPRLGARPLTPLPPHSLSAAHLSTPLYHSLSAAALN